jgi:hypothetical protein
MVEMTKTKDFEVANTERWFWISLIEPPVVENCPCRGRDAFCSVESGRELETGESACSKLR